LINDLVNRAKDEDLKSILTTEVRSHKTNKTSSTVISKLQKQLDEEKKARERLKEEIDELKKMNNELCNAILSTNGANSTIGINKNKK
jgi:predicted RNase H-like nuclease (RuvC/YqgF family)